MCNTLEATFIRLFGAAIVTTGFVILQKPIPVDGLPCC